MPHAQVSLNRGRLGSQHSPRPTLLYSCAASPSPCVTLLAPRSLAAACPDTCASFSLPQRLKGGGLSGRLSG
eukprot:6173883-Pleurochrysis_carterae.AAC.1